jgi:hypothetical protein
LASLRNLPVDTSFKRGNDLQFRLPASIAIFLGSYLPLALILLAQDIDYGTVGRGSCWSLWPRHPIYSLGIFFICLVCFCLSLLALAVARPKVPIQITSASYIPAELMNYTLPYVVAFMSLDYQETGKFVGLAIFLGWMFWITHKSGQLILNPILIAFGWRLYEITYVFPGDTTPRNGRALSRGLIEAGKRYRHTVVQAVVILSPRVPLEGE